MTILFLLSLILLALSQKLLPPPNYTMKATGHYTFGANDPIPVDIEEYYNTTQIITNTTLQLTGQISINEEYCSSSLAWGWYGNGNALIICKDGQDCDGVPCKCSPELFSDVYNTLQISTKRGIPCHFGTKRGFNWFLYLYDENLNFTYVSNICVDESNGYGVILGWVFVYQSGDAETLIDQFTVTSFDTSYPPQSIFQPPEPSICLTQTSSTTTPPRIKNQLQKHLRKYKLALAKSRVA